METGPDTVAAIDLELAALDADLASTTDVEYAERLAQRRLELEPQRRLALALVAVRRRREAAERAEQALATFTQLEADVTADLLEAARALDAWVEDGCVSATADWELPSPSSGPWPRCAPRRRRTAPAWPSRPTSRRG